MYFLSNPIFRPPRPVANPPFLIQLCNKCGLLERAHSRPQPEQFPHQRGPAVNVNQFKQHRNTPPPPFQQQPLLRLPSMATDMLPTHQDSYRSLSPLESMAARPSDAQQQNRTGGGMTEIGALLDDGAEAVGQGRDGLAQVTDLFATQHERLGTLGAFGDSVGATLGRDVLQAADRGAVGVGQHRGDLAGGRIDVDGETWSARVEPGAAPAAHGQGVTVLRVEGAHLILRPDPVIDWDAPAHD